MTIKKTFSLLKCMSTIEFPERQAGAYTATIAEKVEPELKAALDEIKEHAKKSRQKKDVNEAIRIQLRKIVQEYWAQNQSESA